MKPAIVFEGKEKSFLCVTTLQDGGLEFYAQECENTTLINAALIKLPLKEVEELARYLQDYLGEISSPQ